MKVLNRIKNQIKKNKRLYLTLKKMNKFRQEIKNIFKYHRLEKRQFIILDKKKLVYLNNSKVACSSIKKTFTDKQIKDNYSIHELNWKTKHKINNIENEYFKFTFVRNPFDRLVSCYESKYHKDQEKLQNILHYDKYLLGILRKDQGFENFVKKIVKIPKFLADRHFESQYRLLYEKGECLVDYIGKYENIYADFNKIKKKYDLLPLPHYNKSEKRDWRKYYNKETAKLVYEYYKKDIEKFNYKKDYENLMKFIKNDYS